MNYNNKKSTHPKFLTTYNMWQDSPFFDSRNFNLRRTYYHQFQHPNISQNYRFYDSRNFNLPRPYQQFQQSNRWQGSQYFDSRNFRVQRPYQQFQQRQGAQAQHFDSRKFNSQRPYQEFQHSNITQNSKCTEAAPKRTLEALEQPNQSINCQDSKSLDSKNFNVPQTYQEFQKSSNLEIESFIEPNKADEIKREDTKQRFVSKIDPPESDGIKRDYKNRRIVTKLSLQEDPRLFKFHCLEETEKFSDWQADNKSMASGPSHSKNMPEKQKRLNKIEKQIGKAISTPVQLSKAESMMQRMGWTGGALGKDGKGILEPIAPNTTYAMRNIGLGHESETQPVNCYYEDSIEADRARLQKHALRKFDQQIFKTNVLLTMWDFVKNDAELEIVFETKLTKGERKAIHEMADSFNKTDLGSRTLLQGDIYAEIDKCNMYKLCTESEGADPHRSLCLFKSAPYHIFLITPYDLQPDTEEEKKATVTIDLTDKDSVIDLTNLGDKEVEDSNPLLASITKCLSITKNDDENTSNGDEKNIITENAINEEPKMGKDCVIVEGKAAMNNSDILSNEKTQENLKKLDNESPSVNFHKGIVKIYTKDEIRNLLIEYFTEFHTTQNYSELRFCGDFSAVELSCINQFVNDFEICLSEPDACSRLFSNEGFANLLREQGSNFVVTENRGYFVIYKRIKH